MNRRKFFTVLSAGCITIAGDIWVPASEYSRYGWCRSTYLGHFDHTDHYRLESRSNPFRPIGEGWERVDETLVEKTEISLATAGNTELTK